MIFNATNYTDFKTKHAFNSQKPLGLPWRPRRTCSINTAKTKNLCNTNTIIMAYILNPALITTHLLKAEGNDCVQYWCAQVWITVGKLVHWGFLCRDIPGGGLPSLILNAVAKMPKGNAPIPKDIWKPPSPKPNPWNPCNKRHCF